MAGRQLNFAIRGEQYEKAFDSIASRFLSVVRVPRPEDYGIDAFCHTRLPLDEISSTIAGTFGVQVRGPGCNLQFGGMKSDEWKAYEIEWLRSLAVPLYLARVDVDCSRVDFYSLWPIWLVLGQSASPFRIICHFDDPSNEPYTLPGAVKETDGSKTYGDGTTWVVSLGPPFLSVNQAEVGNSLFAEKAGRMMEKWISFDRLTLIRFSLGVTYAEGIGSWYTNDFDFVKAVVKKKWMAWSSVRGKKINELARIFEPVLVNLGVHLQWQDDLSAYTLIPALEWLDSMGLLSEFGKGLLGGLKDTQARGVSPSPKRH
jgi:hypothetical protein